jgi:hypothetical protein
MTDLETELRAGLRREAATVHLRPGSAADVVAAGRRRRLRHRFVGTVTALAVLGAAVGAAGWWSTRDGADHVEVGAADSGTAASGDTSAAAISWQRVDPSVPLGQQPSTILRDDGVMFAVSTEPGRVADGASARAAIYRSSDGVDWTHVSTEDGFSAARLATVGNRLYAVGTVAATSAGETPQSDPAVAYSDDDGATWTTASLPVDLTSLRQRFGSASVHASSIAAGPDAVVAAATVQVSHERLVDQLPPEARSPYGAMVTPEGIDVFGPPTEPLESLAEGYCPHGWTLGVDGDGLACTSGDDERMPLDGVVLESSPVIATYSFVEAGIVEEEAHALLGRPVLFASVDGGEFQEVAVPFDQAGWSYGDQLLATPSGFVMVHSAFAEDRAVVSVARSADGVTWEQVGEIPGVDVAQAAVVRDGTVAVFGSTGAALSQDGVNWETVDLATAAGLAEPGHELSVAAVAAGPAGFAVVAHDSVIVASPPARRVPSGSTPAEPAPSTTAPPSGAPVDGADLVVTGDSGYALRFYEDGADVVDATGTVVGAYSGEPDPSKPLTLVPGEDGSWAVVDGAGTTVVDFPAAAIARAEPELVLTDTAGYALYSPDGRSWSATPLADLLGDVEGYASSVTVAETVRVTVALTDEAPEDGVVPKAVLVGTPG